MATTGAQDRDDTALAETRTARIVRDEDGIVLIRIRPEVEQSPEDAAANVAAARSLGTGRCPALVDIRLARALPAETRHFYSGRHLDETFTALALVVPTGAFGRMFGNVYLRVTRPGIPAQLFADENAALTWLRGFLP
jgi:hypothetical protein